MQRDFSPRTLLAAALAAVAIAITACGGDDGGGGPDPAQLVPPDARLFVEAVVRPEGELADGARAALEKLTGSDDPGGFIVSQLDDLLAQDDAGVTFEQDIEPWLGPRAGAFVSEIAPNSEPDFTLMFAVNDESAAQETVDRLNAVDNVPPTDESYEGVSYSLSSEDAAVGFIGEFLVIGNDAGFKAAVDASNGESLAAESSYTELIGLAEPDRLISAYADSPSLIGDLAATGDVAPDDVESVLDQLGAAGEGVVVAWAALTADTVSLELAAPAVGGSAPASATLLEGLPANSWLAVAGADVGETIGAAAATLTGGADIAAGSADVGGAIERELGLDPVEDFAWLGDAAAFVAGTSVFGIGVGIVGETRDPAASAAALQRLRGSLARGGSVEVGPASRGTGFRLGVPGVPLGAEVVQEGSQVIVAGGGASVDDLLDPGSADLASAEGFQRAQDGLGDDFEVSAYLNFVDLLDVIEEVPDIRDDPDFQSARDVLDGFDFFAAGTRRDGDVEVLGAVLGLREAAGGGDPSSPSAAAATVAG